MMRHVMKVLLGVFLVLMAKQSVGFMLGQEVLLRGCLSTQPTCFRQEIVTVVDGEDPDEDARQFGIGTIDIDASVVTFGLVTQNSGAGTGDVDAGFFNGWVVSGIEYPEFLTGIEIFDVSDGFNPLQDEIQLTEDGFTINFGRGGPALGAGTASFRFLSEAAPAVVPLPPAAILFASSLATLGLLARRRRGRPEISATNGHA
jgi:hypothetical protein